MHLDFMTPDVWNGLVLAVVLIGGAVAALELVNDYSRYKRKQARRPHDRAGENGHIPSNED